MSGFHSNKTWKMQLSGLRHHSCCYITLNVYVYELWCFTLYNRWSRLWNFMLSQPYQWGFKSSGRGHGAVRQVVPDVANSAFVFRLQQMTLKMTHCEHSQGQEPLTQLQIPENLNYLVLNTMQLNWATLCHYGQVLTEVNTVLYFLQQQVAVRQTAFVPQICNLYTNNTICDVHRNKTSKKQYLTLSINIISNLNYTRY